MESIQTFQTLWFYILVFLFAGYTILDGFDLGIGMLFGLRKDDESREQLLATVAPFWDGNEVWLLTGGASLFAVFPVVFASVLSGMYLVFVAAVLALILRAVSFEFWHHDIPRRTLWGTLFCATSLLIPFVLGALLGCMVQGVWINHQGDIWNVFPMLARPLPLVMGMLGVAVTLLHGIAFASMKTKGTLREEILALGKRLRIVGFVLLTGVVVLVLIFLPQSRNSVVMWVGIGIAATAMLTAFVCAGKGYAGIMFAATSSLIIGLWTFIAGVHFPNLIRAVNIPGNSMTVFNSSSSLMNLQFMAVCVMSGILVVIGYTALVYRIFKGKATVTEEGY